jgi:ribosomal protein S15P/S13E
MARAKKPAEEHLKNGTYRFDRYGKILDSDIDLIKTDITDLMKEIAALKIEIENTEKSDIKKRKALNIILNQNRRILLSYKKLPLNKAEQQDAEQQAILKELIEYGKSN